MVSRNLLELCELAEKYNLKPKNRLILKQTKNDVELNICLNKATRDNFGFLSLSLALAEASKSRSRVQLRRRISNSGLGAIGGDCEDGGGVGTPKLKLAGFGLVSFLRREGVSTV